MKPPGSTASLRSLPRLARGPAPEVLAALLPECAARRSPRHPREPLALAESERLLQPLAAGRRSSPAMDPWRPGHGSIRRHLGGSLLGGSWGARPPPQNHAEKSPGESPLAIDRHPRWILDGRRRRLSRAAARTRTHTPGCSREGEGALSGRVACALGP